MTIVKTTEFDTKGQPMEHDAYYCDHCKEFIDHKQRHTMADEDFLESRSPKYYGWPFGSEYHWRCWAELWWPWKKANPKWRRQWRQRRVSVRDFVKRKRAIELARRVSREKRQASLDDGV